MSEEINQELLEALDTLCEKYIANRGSDVEFILCITPNGIPWYWVRAEQVIEKARQIQAKKNGK